MYRFLLRPAWLLFHAVVVAGIVGMILLGFWQLDRLEERQDFNAAVRERSQQQPVDVRVIIDELDAGVLDESQVEWRPVTAAGTYLPDQVIEFNNSQSGRAGDNVLAGLALDDGTTVVVNRGFVPLGDPLPPAPRGDVAIVGFVRLSEVRDRGGLTDADDGQPVTELRRIDIPRLSAQLPGNVAEVFVQLTESDPAIAAGDPSPVVLPELDDGPHLSYAMQWFIFAICVGIGWVLAIRRSLSVRAAARRKANADPPPADDDEAANPPVRTPTA